MCVLVGEFGFGDAVNFMRTQMDTWSELEVSWAYYSMDSYYREGPTMFTIDQAGKKVLTTRGLLVIGKFDSGEN